MYGEKGGCWEGKIQCGVCGGFVFLLRSGGVSS